MPFQNKSIFPALEKSDKIFVAGILDTEIDGKRRITSCLQAGSRMTTITPVKWYMSTSYRAYNRYLL